MAWVKPSAEELERRKQAFLKIEQERKTVHSSPVKEQEQTIQAENVEQTVSENVSSTRKPERLSNGEFSVQLNPDDFSDKKNSPFALKNTSGYKIAIGHPAIHPHYLAYKKFVEEGMILSDAQRHDFESYILAEFKKLGITPDQFETEEKVKPQKKWNGYGR